MHTATRPPPRAEAELKIENLRIGFKKNGREFHAVRGIDFELKRCETLALVGESGCGKTVTALSILRLLAEPPAKVLSGSIRLGGVDLLGLSEEGIRKVRGREIAMIFQDPMTSLNPVLSIGEQIMETLRRHTSLGRKNLEQRAVDLLRRVEIPSPVEKLRQYPHQLSGGMRQRVMIAIALSCEPRILIADEPTTALDVLVQAQIMDLLKQLKADTGLSILLITHDLGIVSEIADRALVMYAGEIVESGPVAQLFQSPLHPYTRGLLTSVPQIGRRPAAGRLQEITGQVPRPEERPAGCAFHPRCPSAMDRCLTDAPVLEEKRPGRRASCWLEQDAP
ncbi:MAG: ABC transporter ATP-binding protein [Nitrospinaceae bacterium]|jgi:oligopeptide/dipeptide ABC transporter ATP-binding protein|nr:MAG: ABC transporter ATP-binding protein [Nitrospinaceae bacterium]